MVAELSKERKVEAVECDIWMSKDGIPMVLHGLGEGNMSQYDGLSSDDIVFRWTREELQSKIDIGGGQVMPTLEEWFQFWQDSPDIVLWIDMKSPSPSYWDEYDVDHYMKSVAELIEKYDAGKKTIVSSYSRRALKKMLKAAPSERDFKIV